MVGMCGRGQGEQGHDHQKEWVRQASISVFRQGHVPWSEESSKAPVY